VPDDTSLKAEQRYKSYTARIIDQIKRLDASCMQSGDARLSNVWDEYKVQVQVEHSVFFGLYEDTIRRLIARTVSAIPPEPLIQMWHVTPQGLDSAADQGSSRPPGWAEDIEDELLRRVQGAAADAPLPFGFQ
jgi:hypothetical protein